MHDTTTAKIIVTLVLSTLSILGIATFAADPSFSITPISGTQLKLYCTYNFGILINPNGQGYNGFDSTLKFDNANIALTHQSIDPFFTSTTSGFIASGNLYRTYGVKPGGSSSTALTAANFLLASTQNIVSSFLEFTTLTGGTIGFNQNTTDDGAVINSSISSLDILTGITNAGYTFLPVPCIIDNEQPSIMNTTPSNNANNIASGQVVSFTIYDRAGPGVAAGISPMTNSNNRSHYRYAGLDSTNINNYQQAPSTVDNQAGVRSGTIKVSIACPTCSGAWAYAFTAANLNITSWTGNSTIHRYTRNSMDRGYVVNFPAPTPYGYEVEKKVTMIITGSDNPNELGVTHTGSFTIMFNAPVNPTISLVSPNNGSTFIDPKISPIIFDLYDAWAGINTGSIKITLPAIYSGATLLYTGKTYSGTDFTTVLTSGQPGLGNSGSYQISFTPTRSLPENTGIVITGYIQDLANNVTTGSRGFSTRPGCLFFGCSTTFGMTILEGMFTGNFAFSGSLLQVTGTNITSPYPYLTGINNDILMCGIVYTGTILTGNIGIYNTTGTQINGTLFTGSRLYITGMDGINFILSGDTIIIQ